jgi:hypothetical protein
MPATLTLDDQLYHAAQKAAAARHVGVEEFVAEAVRRAVNSPIRIVEKNGLPVVDVGPNASRITSDDVRRAEDEP